MIVLILTATSFYGANSELAFHFCLQRQWTQWVSVLSRNVKHIISISKILEINRNHNVNSLFVWRSCWDECVLAPLSIQNMKFNQHDSVNWCGFCHEINIEIKVDSITSDKYWCFVVNTQFMVRHWVLSIGHRVWSVDTKLKFE